MNWRFNSKFLPFTSGNRVQDGSDVLMG